MKIKMLFLAIALAAAGSAFAAPVYHCTGADPGALLIQLSDDGQQVEFLGKSSPVKQVSLETDDHGKSGYVNFRGQGGCSQNLDVVIHCFAMFTVDFQVSEKIMAGDMQGDVIYNGETMQCKQILAEAQGL